MKNYRATLDQEVIDAWATQLSKRNRGLAKTQLILLFALALAAALMFFMRHEAFAWLFFALGIALVIAQIADRHTLLCPHCLRSPISGIEGGTAAQADYCAHCYYWLKNPHKR